LVSREEAYRIRELVLVVPVTTNRRGIPTEVALGREEGLPRRCVANADIVTTIPKQLLTDQAGSLSTDKVSALDTALRFALGLE
jgi:mRNA interferase MazF